jgi:hypothetical protein
MITIKAKIIGVEEKIRMHNVIITLHPENTARGGDPRL